MGRTSLNVLPTLGQQLYKVFEFLIFNQDFEITRLRGLIKLKQIYEKYKKRKTKE